MTALEFRTYELGCDAPGCRKEFRGVAGQSRAALRKRAARAGWTHVHRDGHPHGNDKDFCPDHKPAGEG